ncbi:30S ribosomal protein S3 [Candidatus Woesearchaeota archaeon]|nr:30S ribosomal protein S3 [Candidatus Woesearchaeota archaeon]
MIERKFINDKKKEFAIEEYITANLKNVGHSKTELRKTPLGDRIIVHAARPGLVVGKKGETIKKLTQTLKKRFKLENPEIEPREVEQKDQMLDADIVAERIASTLERFGVKRFKGIAHRVMNDVLRAGALGVEIIMSGRIPSVRAKKWRFFSGYIKKCGDVALEGMHVATNYAVLKQGRIGVKVSIMPPDIKLPDDIEVPQEVPEPEVKEEKPKKKTVKKAKKETVEKVGKKPDEDTK